MLQKIVIEEVINEETGEEGLAVNSNGDVTNDFIFSSIIALLESLNEVRGFDKKQVVQSLLKFVEESEESKESGEPINEVKRSID